MVTADGQQAFCTMCARQQTVSRSPASADTIICSSHASAITNNGRSRSRSRKEIRGKGAHSCGRTDMIESWILYPQTELWVLFPQSESARGPPCGHQLQYTAGITCRGQGVIHTDDDAGSSVAGKGSCGCSVILQKDDARLAASSLQWITPPAQHTTQPTGGRQQAQRSCDAKEHYVMLCDVTRNT
jgi:hypothetical protein